MNYKTVFLLLGFIQFLQIDAMKIIGHRGACGYEPENTLSSFAKALEMNVDMVELDVYVCATGELVVIHDDYVDRVSNGQGKVVDKTFQELRSLIIESKERIPTLQEIIELINKRIPLNIELKGPNTAEPVAQLVKEYLQSGWETTDFLVSSFDHDEVLKFRNFCSDIKIGFLYRPGLFRNFLEKTGLVYRYWISDSDIKQLRKGDIIGLKVMLASKEFVHELHNHDLKVFVFTVNDKHTADLLRKMNVDAIFSNCPDKV